MKTISEVGGQELHWVQPHVLKQHFELRDAGGQVVASVERRGGLLRSSDEVEAVGGRWRIDHGLAGRRFEIRPAEEAGPPRYLFEHPERLTLPDGQIVTWRKHGADAIYSWTSAEGVMLLRLTSGDGGEVSPRLRIELGAAEAGTRLLLAMLGAYLILLYTDDVG